ncbi:DUF4007 family protein [Pontibacillus salicampi]|uniref:DUF4007 family protein n=1 Tax=Pontibacillus salicampi TaxID=1449801 RepID=A0ABV6LUJ3_9BACI
MDRPRLIISEGYNLHLEIVSEILEFTIKNEKKSYTRKEISEEIGYGERMVKSVMNFGIAMGIIKKRTYTPTKLGEIIHRYDPFITDPGTLWVLHYVSSSNPQLLIWNKLFNSILYKSQDGELSTLINQFDEISEFVSENTLKKNLRGELSSVLNAYCEQEFRKVGIISKDDNEYFWYKNQPINEMIFLSLIYWYKEMFHANISTIDIDFLLKEKNSPGRICLFELSYMRKILEKLGNNKLITLETRADLDQVRFRDNFNFYNVLELYYGGQHA